MNRKGILISNPGESGEENYCEGVKKDVANYRSFLLSSIGGLWRESEIEGLNRPSVTQVRQAISSLRNLDYSLIIFTGHGYHDTRLDSTMLELRSGHLLDSSELREGSKKQTLILDCCRKKYPVKPTLMMDSARMLKKAAVINPSDCRKYYNSRINECGDGLIVIHSCNIDELSGDDATRGGYYSYALLEESRKWAEDSDTDTSRSVGFLSLPMAHKSALPRVRSISGTRQSPQIEKPRTGPYFPFCIVA